jgi:glycosyltransferase involved in cell wall biosynthesis
MRLGDDQRENKNFVVIHNIPTPYRIHLFNVLNRQLEARGIRFEVHFMAGGHEDRPAAWTQELGRAEFPYTIWDDRGITLRKGFRWHWNPALVRQIWVQRPTYLLVGGQWDSATGLAMTSCAWRSSAIAWLEPNTHSPGHVRGLAGFAKRWVLRQYDHVAVPGEDGRQWLLQLGLPRPPDAVALPNLVDESRFSRVPGENLGSTRSALGLPRDARLALWIARLTPAKGVCAFLSKLSPTLLEGWRILLVGDGPLKADVKRCIIANGLSNVVQLRSAGPYGDMPALYRASDLFLLPSLSDPNPLSVIEAMHSGLALLVSNRLGNYPEALHPGINGWGFDPEDEPASNAAIADAFGSTREALHQMGEASKAIAAEKWDSSRAVAAFLRSTVG